MYQMISVTVKDNGNILKLNELVKALYLPVSHLKCLPLFLRDPLNSHIEYMGPVSPQGDGSGPGEPRHPGQPRPEAHVRQR